MKIDEKSIVRPLPDDELFEYYENIYRLPSLPDDFINFMKNYNGATPISNTFNTHDNEYVIERFLCMLDDYKSDEENGWYEIRVVFTQLDTRLIDDEDMVGTNILPVAALFSGDFLCLDFRKSDNPGVCVWFHEESDDFEPFTKEVAETFTEFLDMLRERS